MDVAGSEFDAAEGNFVSTIPTTIPGITAKLHQIAQLDDGAMTFPDVKEALALILRSPQLGRGPDEPAGLPRHHHLAVMWWLSQQPPLRSYEPTGSAAKDKAVDDGKC